MFITNHQSLIILHYVRQCVKHDIAYMFATCNIGLFSNCMDQSLLLFYAYSCTSLLHTEEVLCAILVALLSPLILAVAIILIILLVVAFIIILVVIFLWFLYFFIKFCILELQNKDQLVRLKGSSLGMRVRLYISMIA